MTGVSQNLRKFTLCLLGINLDIKLPFIQCAHRLANLRNHRTHVINTLIHALLQLQQITDKTSLNALIQIAFRHRPNRLIRLLNRLTHLLQMLIHRFCGLSHFIVAGHHNTLTKLTAVFDI